MYFLKNISFCKQISIKRNYLSLIIFIITFPSQFYAQNFNERKLDSIIRVCVNKIDVSETIENMKWSAAMMERVTKLNNCWSSNYYLAYFNLLAAFEAKELEQKEILYDAFLSAYSVSESLAKNDREKSELLTLKAFQKIDMIVVDPIKNGKELSAEIIELFEKAMQLYPNNPRAIYLNAVFKSNLASFFKKDENYCDDFLKANKLFVKDLIYSRDYLMPLWGAEHNSVLLSRCFGRVETKKQ